MNFENFQDYLLSINIAQIAREFGFKKVGMNSIYLLTQLLKKYIKDLSSRARDYSELAGRSEANLIDVLNVLNERQITKESIVRYTKDSKLKFQFNKRMYISKIFACEYSDRQNFIRKINQNNVCSSTAVSDSLISLIPKPIRYFPREFALVQTENKNEGEMLEEKKSKIKNIEKKSLEEIISSNNYFDNLSKKHKRKNSLDLNMLFDNVDRTDRVGLGKTIGSVGLIGKYNTPHDANVDENLNLNEDN